MRRVLWCCALLFSACGTDPIDPCRDAPTYDTDIRRIVDDKCITCHAQALMGSARMGAPDTLDFDDYATIQPNLDALADAITSGREPPRDTPDAPPATSAVERQLVNEWRRCGYPEDEAAR